MKCPVCTTKKGKRACLLTSTCICSACCGSKRNKESCNTCIYFREPQRNYKNIPSYSPAEMNGHSDCQDISNVIESAISEFDYNTGDSIRDDIPIRILECLLDIYYFKEQHQQSEDPLLEKGLHHVLSAIQDELANIDHDKLIKILGAIYFVAKRRTTGQREYLSIIRQYVGIRLANGSRIMVLPETKQEPKCRLCGNTKKALTKTACCDNWICDDEHTYVIFSYARNSCYRNHDRYTLCSYHSHENHTGRWQDCKKCKDDFDLPNYVNMGTNEYNFEVLENPEKVSITCVNCNFTADTVDAFAYQTSNGYYCPKKKCQEAALKR